MPTFGLETTAVNAAGMYANAVFEGKDLCESQAYMQRAIVEHEVRAGYGRADAALFMRSTPRLQLMVLRYGVEVEITPRLFDDFSLVQVPLRGATRIHCDGEALDLVPGQSALVSPRHALKILWSSECEQLIVRIPNALFHQAALDHMPWRQRLDMSKPLLSPVTLIDGDAGWQWNALLGALLTATEQQAPGAAAGHPAWIAHCEQGLAVHLLTQQRHLNAPDDRAGTQRGNPLAAAEKFARDRLAAPVSMDDLARSAGVSARTLHLHWKRQYGTSPMEWLRNLRLDAAREQLQSNPFAPITDVALSCGFSHLGRFAAYYRDRFGELPRHTKPQKAS